MKDQPISTLMQRRTQTVSMDASMREVEEFLTREGLSWAPVTDDKGELVGVISDADLRRFFLCEGDPATPAWRQCTYRPMGVSPDTTVSAVASLMIERRIHHVVVTDQGRIIGVVSSLDLVKTLI